MLLRKPSKKLSNDLVEIQIIHGGAGAITETDVNLAMAL